MNGPGRAGRGGGAVGGRLTPHLAGTRRAPASNEKLLLSMTALSELGPNYRIPTDAAVESGA